MIRFLAGLLFLLTGALYAADYQSPDPNWMPSHLYFFGGSLRPRTMTLVKDPEAPTGEAGFSKVGVQQAGGVADSYTYETIPGKYLTRFYFKTAANTGNDVVLSYGIWGAVGRDPSSAGDNQIYLKASDFKKAKEYQIFEYRWDYYEHGFMVAWVNWFGKKDLWWGGIETQLVEPFSDEAVFNLWRNPPKQQYYVPFPPKDIGFPEIATNMSVRWGTPRVHLVEGMFYDRFGIEEALRLIDGATLTESETTDGGQVANICPKFPKVDKLFEHNVLVLANIDIRRLGVLKRYAIREFVNRGGGLLVLGGPWTYGRCGMKGTWIDELLPVSVKGRSDWLKLPEGSLLRCTDKAPSLVGDQTLEDSPCVSYLHDINLRSGSQVFMEAAGKPVLVGWERGKGRVAAFLGTVMGEPGEGHHGFWESKRWPKTMVAILQWLSHDTVR